MPVLAGYAHLLAAGRRAQWDETLLELAPLADPPPAALVGLVAGFRVAEAAVAEHLVPFIDAAGDPELAEALEMQAADEARHARFFERVWEEALGAPDVAASPALRELFGVVLPARAAAVAAGQADLVDGVALYHLVLEGIVLQSGMTALLDELGRVHAPGVLAGARRVQADERWHIGLGVTVLRERGGPNVLAGVADATELAVRCWEHPAADEAHARELLGRRLAIASAS